MNHRKWKLKAIEALGGKCVHCGFTNWRALQIDHVNSQLSNQEKKRIMGRVTYYKKIIEEVQSGEYQLLCANCNWIKRYEQGESGGKHRSK